MKFIRELLNVSNMGYLEAFFFWTQVPTSINKEHLCKLSPKNFNSKSNIEFILIIFKF